MESGSFLGGLLRGFGGGVLDAQQQQHQQDIEEQRLAGARRKETLDFFTKAIDNKWVDPSLGYPLITGLFRDELEAGFGGKAGRGGKGKTGPGMANALAALADPENFGQFLVGAHHAMSGTTPTTKVGPTGLPTFGPVAVGRASAPEDRPQTVTPPSPDPASEVTALSPEEDQQFQTWVADNQITDLDHPDSHYDYRGYWKATGGAPHQPGDHYPDTFKQHGHPTFSVESQYSRGPNDGGRWAGDQFLPPLERLEGRSTLMSPKPTLFRTPQEQQRLQLEEETNKQVTQTQAGYTARIRVAQQMVKDGLAVDMTEALAKVGMRNQASGNELNARALYEQAVEVYRSTHGGAQPGPTERTAMMRTALQQEADDTRRRSNAANHLTGDIGQRTDQALALQGIDPLNATPAQRTAAAKVAAERLDWERKNPFWKSTSQPNELGTILYEMFGNPDPASGDEPRTMTRPGRLTPAQLTEGSLEKEKRDAREQGSITAAREREKAEAAKKKILPPNQAGALQVKYGTTVEEAAALARTPLTDKQRDAGGAILGLERDVTEAETLFEKVWPRVANPEARRVALGQLQRSQNPDFANLQAALARMPIRQAVLEQGSRPSDTDMLIFKAGMPNTQSGNWDLVQVPSTYESGKELLAATRRMLGAARKDIGFLKPEERDQANRPKTAPAPGYTIDARGNIKDAAGTIISGPDKPR